MLQSVTITIGEAVFDAQLRDDLAPQTCRRFRALLPWTEKIIHARWSGEACWIPLGGFDLGAPFEEATSYPAPGEFIFYPGGLSETEILLPYGPTRFASKAGELAGSPFLSITSNLERLPELGRKILWRGAQSITFKLEATTSLR